MKTKIGASLKGSKQTKASNGHSEIHSTISARCVHRAFTAANDSENAVRYESSEKRDYALKISMICSQKHHVRYGSFQVHLLSFLKPHYLTHCLSFATKLREKELYLQHDTLCHLP